MNLLPNFWILNVEQVMAMGDAENDLSMLKYAYHSVRNGKWNTDSQKHLSLSNGEQ